MRILGRPLNRATLTALLLAAMIGTGIAMLITNEVKQLKPGIVGMVWQPDNATVGIKGDWHKLGARELLV